MTVNNHKVPIYEPEFIAQRGAVVQNWGAPQLSSEIKTYNYIRYSVQTFLRHKSAVLIWSRLRKLAPQTVWSVPEAATTVLCTPDDWRDGRPKHVE